MSALLETVGLTRFFGSVRAAEDLNMRVEQGETVGIIGSNGSGKTTFLNLATGYLKPERGSILLDGHDTTALPPRAITRLGVARSFQIPQLFNSLSARANLLVAVGVVAAAAHSWAHSDLTPARAGEASDEILERFGLAAYREREAGLLPEGVRKLLDVAMALVVKPRILLLDEPTSGVSADEKFAIMDLVMGAVRGVTVLFVEHDMDIVARYAGRVLAFADGRIIADGPPATVLADAEVRRFVIGEAHA